MLCALPDGRATAPFAQRRRFPPLLYVGGSFQISIIHVPEMLGEFPAMTFGVNTLIDAIAPKLIGRFAEDLCPGVEGALVVSVHVVDKDVESATHFVA